MSSFKLYTTLGNKVVIVKPKLEKSQIGINLEYSLFKGILKTRYVLQDVSANT